jgi:5'-nucleotidase
MQILLTNDDGIFANGLAAMERALRKIGNVMVAAPSTEQSGVSQSITFLRPLVGHQIYDGDRLRGYAIDGTPADCVKLAVTQYCAHRPDLIVSGINGGLNAGINVLYSGTVGAAMEGALFGIPSFAVSLEWDEDPKFDAAADYAIQLIQQTMAHRQPDQHLFNINFPTQALTQDQPEVSIVPMATNRYGHHFIKRMDPKKRTYYWATNDPEPEPSLHMTDVMELKIGKVTLTPLHVDLTLKSGLDQMSNWNWQPLSPTENQAPTPKEDLS